MPLRYLFEPWKAPRAVQEKAKCVIGVDYPKPMVDHTKASKECYNLMTEVKRKLISHGPGILIDLLIVLSNLLITTTFWRVKILSVGVVYSSG